MKWKDKETYKIKQFTFRKSTRHNGDIYSKIEKNRITVTNKLNRRSKA